MTGVQTCALPICSSVGQWVIDYWNDNKTFQRIIKEEDTGKAFFTIYWRHGDRQVIPAEPGEPIHKAFTRAGYGAGATHAIDWYDNGDTDTHTWNNITKHWDRKIPFIFYAEDTDSVGVGDHEKLKELAKHPIPNAKVYTFSN